MGISNLTAAASGLSTLVKSIQRGVAASAGNVTITSVDINKTVVNSFSTGAAGSAGGSGSVSAMNGNAAAGGTNTGSSSGSLSLNSWTKQQGNAQSPIGPYASSGPFNAASGSVSFNGFGANVAARGISLNNQSISGGSTNIVSATYGAYLSNSTTLVATGPCRYEIVEYF
jgi:hypothetical protein